MILNQIEVIMLFALLTRENYAFNNALMQSKQDKILQMSANSHAQKGSRV